MGFIYRKRIRTGKNSWFNISKSGLSASQRVGPFTVNSRGRKSIRLGKGMSYRGGCVSVLLVAVGAIAIAGTVISKI